MRDYVKLLKTHLEKIKSGSDVEPLIQELETIDFNSLENLPERELVTLKCTVDEIVKLVQVQKRNVIKAIKELNNKRTSLNAYAESEQR